MIRAERARRNRMKSLSRLERLIAEIVERPAWLLSARRLHPLELSALLTRALEERALRLADRIIAPDDYTVALHPDDLAAFGDAVPVLERELADFLARLIVERDLSSNHPPAVRLVASPELRPGRAEVTARFSAPAEAGARPPLRPRAAAGPAARATSRTATPAQPGPALVLLGADGRETVYPLLRLPLTIGRRPTADIVLADSKVSRDHARIERTTSGVAIVDLGSLNGTFVNGERVSGARALRGGEEIVLGHTRFRYVAGG